MMALPKWWSEDIVHTMNRHSITDISFIHYTAKGWFSDWVLIEWLLIYKYQVQYSEYIFISLNHSIVFVSSLYLNILPQFVASHLVLSYIVVIHCLRNVSDLYSPSNSYSMMWNPSSYMQPKHASRYIFLNAHTRKSRCKFFNVRTTI